MAKAKDTEPAEQTEQAGSAEQPEQPQQAEQDSQLEQPSQPEQDSQLEQPSLPEHQGKAKKQKKQKVATEDTKFRKASKADIIKLCGLGVFFILLIVVCIFLAPYFGGIFEEGGLERTLDAVRDAGPAGVLVLELLQFIQIVVAFIPGEITQIAAGMLYGPLLGALLVLVGCVISSAFVYFIVHKLGAPFVQDVVPTKYLEKFRNFEKSGKLNILVFILFLIPGLPKDTFTYLVPLTDMKIGTFLTLSNVGRIPGILVTAYAANAFVDGHVFESIIIFVVAAAICVAGILLKDKIMVVIDRLVHKNKEA